MKKITWVLISALLLVMLLSACGGEKTIAVDYADAESFEAALNDGANLEGKTVSFEVKKLIPDSAFGYNLVSGEHLNFCSAKNPGVSVGDTVTVKVTEVNSVLGSYVILYEMLK